MVERYVRNVEAVGSNPITSTRSDVAYVQESDTITSTREILAGPLYVQTDGRKTVDFAGRHSRAEETLADALRRLR